MKFCLAKDIIGQRCGRRFPDWAWCTMHPFSSRTDPCRACGKPLLPENVSVADGCPCNSARGVNHGLVAKTTCTCVECDPEQTGSTRPLPGKGRGA